MQRIVSTRMRAVEDPNRSRSRRCSITSSPTANRLDDLVTVRQTMYRQRAGATMHTLYCRTVRCERNLLSEDDYRSIAHPTLTVASGLTSEY
jgi:hypothetical protein